MIKTGILLVLMGGVSAWAATHEIGDVKVKPDQQIHLSQNAWGCASKSNLDAALSQERTGQQQAKQQYFNDARCQTLPADQLFRVVSVDRHDVQFVSADNSDTHGIWVDARFVKE